MANGDELNAELTFEKQIVGMDDRKLLEFTARQVFEIKGEQVKFQAACDQVPDHEKRIATLESGSRKSSVISGGIAGTILAVVIGIIEYFTKK